MVFYNDVVQFFQVVVDVFNFICQLFDFGFEQVEQQFVGVVVDQCLVMYVYMVEVESGQFVFVQCEQVVFVDGKCYGRVVGVIVGIFKKEE